MTFDYKDFFIQEFWKSLEDLKPKFYKEALCARKGTDTFFPKQGQSAKMQEAVLMCFQCPVQVECHDYAMKEQIEHGVWGGSSAEARRGWLREGLTSSQAWDRLTAE